MDHPKILGIMASPRNLKSSHELDDLIHNIQTYDQLYDVIYTHGHSKSISNSEAQLIAALSGSKIHLANVKSVNLKKEFASKRRKSLLDQILSNIVNCDGIVIATPVYFGDRSSWIDSLIGSLKQSSNQKFPLDDKTVGVASVGAKRNGGQETTNVFMLNDVLALGAQIVGNGPPTSQYGGTAWAGDIGGIIDDNFGIMTSFGTGCRVAQVAGMTKLPPIRNAQDLKILVLITSVDKERKFINWLKEHSKTVSNNLKFMDVTKYKIEPCLACRTCPMSVVKEKRLCLITKNKAKFSDQMHLIRKEMLNSDGIVIAHCDTGENKVDSHQIFLERTRHIRRNNFELTDKPFSIISISNDLNNMFTARTMSSFLRHNMVIIGPFYKGFSKDRTIKPIFESISIKTFWSRFIQKTQSLAVNANMNSLNNQEYIPIGYGKN